MIEVEVVDGWFEAGYARGSLITFNLFDPRAIMPIEQMADMLSGESSASITVDDVRQLERAGWLRLEHCSSSEVELGAGLYVLDRIRLFKELQHAGWSGVEMSDYAEFEDSTVRSFADDDDGFPYVEEDLEQLRQHFRLRIQAISHGTKRDGEGNTIDGDDELSNARRQLTFLDQLATTGVPPAMKKSIAKHAFRVRANEEMARVMIVEGCRCQLRAGFTINVAFESWGSDAGENGSRVFVHGNINWNSTVRGAYSASEEKGAEPIIRVPGFTLCGDRVVTSRTVRPHEYDRMWKEMEIDSYLAAWSELRGLPTCMNCYARLPDQSNKNARKTRFCSQKCREAAKARRYRERNPVSASRAREKYRASIAEDE